MSLYNFKKIMVVPPAKVSVPGSRRPAEHPLEPRHNLTAGVYQMRNM